MAGFLSDLLPAAWGGNKPNPQMLGSGGASQAAQALGNRAYQLYVQEARALGQQPLPFEQWKAQQGS